ncbi:cytochrome P450 [Coniophora puteana RWD-64-598 SS2]|uniref:Cytochrome P450 n=1 Tax=Coniophora puteana (strain RWD-64-598) TaxID=741705 RepID=A0A5M3M9M4_CONPW|nr:cytochrome P450 [Coniophora puteana RWD-64-598 SS2]EIW75879.1 cytochrome P450 [Coniophora puteana RWD-64-598 SS2]
MANVTETIVSSLSPYIRPETITALLHTKPTDAALAALSVFILLRLARAAKRRFTATKLRGPPSENWFFGVGDEVLRAPDSSALYEEWEQAYGSVYQIPSTLGTHRVVLCDPRAISHFYAKDTTTYVRTPGALFMIEELAGRNLLWAQGDAHKRQRKALTPAFSNSAIRKLTSVFTDSGYKCVDAWNSIIENSSENNGAVIEVQGWMSNVSLDTIGIAGFAHDFGTLLGKHSSVSEGFDRMNVESPPRNYRFLLSLVIPWIVKFPSKRRGMVKKLNSTMGEGAVPVLQRTREEKAAGAKGGSERSIIELLIKSEDDSAELHMSSQEVLDQMKLLIFAGYETTSIALTWALIELSKNQSTQTKLREELSQFTNSDPTYDQLTNSLPYLDAVALEVLRLHGPVFETTRMAGEDDIIPLSQPVTDASGKLVDHVTVTKGTLVTVPITYANRSVKFWGPRSREFVPERWLDGYDSHGNLAKGASKDLSGHRHLLTFADGSRMCLGKAFAVAEFKAVLSVLVRNFAFELRDGPDTKFESQRTFLPRPRVAGEKGVNVPLRVRRLD